MAFVFTPESEAGREQMAEFKAGEKVTYQGMVMPAEIVSGPHKSPSGAYRYLITKADGNVSLVRVSELSALDDRREKITNILRRECGWAIDQIKRDRIAGQILAVVDKAAPPVPLAVGDRIRILRKGLEFANVSVGDVLNVSEVNATTFHADKNPKFDRIHAFWVFNLSGEGTGWERA